MIENIEFQNELPVKINFGCVWEYPYHWHETLEIVQVMKGTLNITIGDESYIIHENDIVVININELHRIALSPDNEVRFIHIQKDYYNSLINGRKYEYIYCCSAIRDLENLEKYNVIRDYLNNLADMYSENNTDEFNIKNLLNELLNYIIL